MDVPDKITKVGPKRGGSTYYWITVKLSLKNHLFTVDLGSDKFLELPRIPDVQKIRLIPNRRELRTGPRLKNHDKVQTQSSEKKKNQEGRKSEIDAT